MEQQDQLLLEPLLEEATISRRSLLPIWIKVFCWIFLFTGVIALLCLFAGVFGTTMHVALYGLESTEPLSAVGLLLLLIYLLKGIVAFGLWTEKDWAIQLAFADAFIGIAICVYMMFVLPFVSNAGGFSFTFRLELVALIPYLLKLRQLKPQWQRGQE